MKNKILFILKIIAAVFLILFGVWAAFFFRINVGGLLAKWFPKKDAPDVIKGVDGLPVGTVSDIKVNSNPLRDKTVVELVTGETIKLPVGIVDTDVQKIVVIEQGVVDVVKKGTNLTDIFNDPKPDNNGG